MDHNGRMWFEREPWGPWDPHTRYPTISERPTISYQAAACHTQLFLTDQGIPIGLHIHFKAPVSQIVPACSEIWCLPKDSPQWWSVFLLCSSVIFCPLVAEWFPHWNAAQIGSETKGEECEGGEAGCCPNANGRSTHFAASCQNLYSHSPFYLYLPFSAPSLYKMRSSLGPTTVSQ